MIGKIFNTTPLKSLFCIIQGMLIGQIRTCKGLGSTNDKAGSALNLYRWLSARVIKENLSPSAEVVYPFMQAE